MTMIQQNNPRSLLEQRYHVLDFQDLADVTSGPGKIYTLLEKHYRPAFEQNQRIVFYTQYRLPQDLLLHIKQACLHIDISASFLLFCSPWDCSSEILETFGEEDRPGFVVVPVESKKLENNYHYPDTICPLPWMHIATMPQGEIKPCCHNNDTVGYVQKDSLGSVFDSQQMIQLRKELASGLKSKSCQHCWSIESHGGTSMRQILLQKYKTKFLDEWINDPRIRSVDIKAGNTCNFKCRICEPAASSSIASEHLKLESDPKNIQSLKQIIKQSKWFDTSDSLMIDIIKLSSHLVNLDFYGGEPFLLKSLNTLLEKLIAANTAEQIQIHVNSNGSIFPNHLIKNLSKFKHSNICLSIDDIGHRFELQRGGNWKDIDMNVQQYQKLDPIKFSISVYTIINIQNVFYLDELIAWAAQKNIDMIVDYLEQPSWLSVENLTESARKIIIEKFTDSNHPMLQSVVRKIQRSELSDGKEFCKQMTELDRRRKQNFAKHHYEIAKAMGYIV